jgi:hypothetical protein
LFDDGHSRHVVVHLSAGSHVSVDEHQPQPGESSWQPHTSVAAAHTSDEDTLNARATSFACAAAASSSESACSLRRIGTNPLDDLFLPTGFRIWGQIFMDIAGYRGEETVLFDDFCGGILMNSFQLLFGYWLSRRTDEGCGERRRFSLRRR